jgi:hypothetical protein
MTQLRVFQDPQDRLWVEITSPTTRLTRIFFLRAYWSDSLETLALNRNELVTVEFQRTKLKVAFLMFISRRREILAKFKQIGLLDDDASRDVLNNFLDILAYDRG